MKQLFKKEWPLFGAALLPAILLLTLGVSGLVPWHRVEAGVPLKQRIVQHNHHDPLTGGTLNLPSFRAYLLSTQSVTCSTPTVVTINQISFDNSSTFNTGTYRYVAPFTGYYLFTINAKGKATTTFTNIGTWLRRNGAQYSSNIINTAFTINNDSTIILTDIMWMGAGDYADVQVAVGGTGTCNVDGLWFTGIMISY